MLIEWKHNKRINGQCMGDIEHPREVMHQQLVDDILDQNNQGHETWPRWSGRYGN